MEKQITQFQLRNMLFELGNRAVFVGLDTETEPKVKASSPPILKRARINGRAGAKYRDAAFDRSWGKRLAESPLVEYKDTYYLEIEVTKTPEEAYFDKDTGEEITKEEAVKRGYRDKGDSPYLQKFRDYKLSSIKGIRINGDSYEVTA